MPLDRRQLLGRQIGQDGAAIVLGECRKGGCGVHFADTARTRSVDGRQDAKKIGIFGLIGGCCFISGQRVMPLPSFVARHRSLRVQQAERCGSGRFPAPLADQFLPAPCSLPSPWRTDEGADTAARLRLRTGEARHPASDRKPSCKRTPAGRGCCRRVRRFSHVPPLEWCGFQDASPIQLFYPRPLYARLTP